MCASARLFPTQKRTGPLLGVAVFFLLECSASCIAQAGEFTTKTDQTADPIWTTAPVRVDPMKQNYERLPDRVPEPSIDSLFPLKFPRSLHYRVEDSVTFAVGGEKYRIAGLDPIEPRKICRAVTGSRWSCGVKSKVALGRLLRSKLLLCRSIGKVKDATAIECVRNQEDLGAVIAVSGHALLPAGDMRYAAEIDVARQQKVGVWADGP